VALTRARRHLFILGNSALLHKSQLWNALLSRNGILFSFFKKTNADILYVGPSVNVPSFLRQLESEGIKDNVLADFSGVQDELTVDLLADDGDVEIGLQTGGENASNDTEDKKSKDREADDSFEDDELVKLGNLEDDFESFF
jgi:hypothetical protein